MNVTDASLDELRDRYDAIRDASRFTGRPVPADLRTEKAEIVGEIARRLART